MDKILSSIKQRVLQYIDNQSIKKEEFYEKTGISASNFKGPGLKSEIGGDKIAKILSIYPDINAEWLITGIGDMFKGIIQQNTGIVKPKSNLDLGIPKVVAVDAGNKELISLVNVKAAAGYLNGYADPEYIEQLPVIAVPGVNGNTHRAFEINGHSMSPTFHHRSIVIGSWVEKFEDIRDRYIYIVVSKTDGVVAKRVLNRIDERGNLVLISDNQHKTEFPNIILDPDDVLELWRARLLLSHNFPEPVYWQDRFNDLESEITFLKHDLKNLQNKSLNAG